MPKKRDRKNTGKDILKRKNEKVIRERLEISGFLTEKINRKQY